VVAVLFCFCDVIFCFVKECLGSGADLGVVSYKIEGKQVECMPKWGV
jgi:hypothetical protein